MDRNSEVAEPMQTVIRRLKDLRRERGLTAQQVADRMTAVGIPWEYGVVTKLETGRRKSLSITEWLALARVLDVPPLTLLLPAEDTEYQITPASAPLPARAVGEWLTAPKPLPPAADQEALTVHPGMTLTRQHRYFADWPAYLRRPPTVPEVEERADALNKQLAERQQDLQRLIVEVDDQRHRLALADAERTRRREQRWEVERELITLMERRRASEVNLMEAHRALANRRQRLEVAWQEAKDHGESAEDTERHRKTVLLNRAAEEAVREAEMSVTYHENAHRRLLRVIDRLGGTMKALEEGDADGN